MVTTAFVVALDVLSIIRFLSDPTLKEKAFRLGLVGAAMPALLGSRELQTLWSDALPVALQPGAHPAGLVLNFLR